MWAWLRAYLAQLIAEIHNLAISFTDALIDFALELSVTFVQFFLDFIPGLESFNLQANLDTLFNSPHYEFLMYLVPFQACFAIWLTSVVIAGTIRLIRFAIGWIPTIEG